MKKILVFIFVLLTTLLLKGCTSDVEENAVSTNLNYQTVKRFTKEDDALDKHEEFVIFKKYDDFISSIPVGFDPAIAEEIKKGNSAAKVSFILEENFNVENITFKKTSKTLYIYVDLNKNAYALNNGFTLFIALPSRKINKIVIKEI